MSEDRLHIVFGTGLAGNALAAYPAGRGIAVRALSRHRSRWPTPAKAPDRVFTSTGQDLPQQAPQVFAETVTDVDGF
jgi:hypothetical protein